MLIIEGCYEQVVPPGGESCTVHRWAVDVTFRMLVPSVLLNGKDKKEDATNGKDKKEDATLLSKPEILQLGGR